MAIQPVILAGGTGTRLWPLSRELYPKQVIRLLGEHSLLQNTLLRAALIPKARVPLLVASEQQRFMIQHQVQSLGRSARMLLEPVARDTGAAVCGAAAFHRACGAADDVLLILPADHLIRRTEAFLAAVASASWRGAVLTETRMARSLPASTAASGVVRANSSSRASISARQDPL